MTTKAIFSSPVASGTCKVCGGRLDRPVPPSADSDLNPIRCHYRDNYCPVCKRYDFHWGGCADQNGLADYPYGKHPIPYPLRSK